MLKDLELYIFLAVNTFAEKWVVIFQMENALLEQYIFPVMMVTR